MVTKVPTQMTEGVLAGLGGVQCGDAVLRVKKIGINAAPTGSEQDTLFDLPSKGILLDIFVDVRTAEATGATKTMDIGLLSSESGGDADGFVRGLSFASTGVKRPVFASTVGANNTYAGAAASHTIGALLTGLLIAGEDVAAGGDGVVSMRPFSLNSVTAKSVTFTSGSADWVEFRGDIYLVYLDMS